MNIFRRREMSIFDLMDEKNLLMHMVFGEKGGEIHQQLLEKERKAAAKKALDKSMFERFMGKSTLAPKIKTKSKPKPTDDEKKE